MPHTFVHLGSGATLTAGAGLWRSFHVKEPKRFVNERKTGKTCGPIPEDNHA
jgi:hypothetical protein